MKTIQILIVILAIVSVSCSISSIEEFVVGENFINDKSGILMIDTMTIKSSTYKYDSIISNSTDRFLIGCNYNTFSGYKNSNAFMEMAFDGNILYTTFVFDSICMILNYDTYYYGDTTTAQTFSVHQILEEMETDDDGYLYTTSKFAYQSSPLGSKTFKPRPNSSSSLSIRLSDQFGNRLAQMIKDEKDTITSSYLFNKFFNGLVIKSVSDAKSAVVSFSMTSTESSSTEITTSSTTGEKPEIRLYYHLSPNPDNLTDLYYSFSMSSDGIYFNQISGDCSGSLIANIENTNNEMSSTLTNKQTIVQAGIQLFTKIDIPYVDNLLMIGQNSAFISASLRLYPVKGTYKNSSDLPSSLYLYNADRLNKLTGQATSPGSTDYVYAELNIITDVEEVVYYEADISSFVDTELKEELETNRSLMIGYGASDAVKNTNHLILGGPKSGTYAPKLNIYYYHN